jgi:hypothetical protein
LKIQVRFNKIFLVSQVGLNGAYNVAQNNITLGTKKESMRNKINLHQ